RLGEVYQKRFDKPVSIKRGVTPCRKSARPSPFAMLSVGPSHACAWLGRASFAVDIEAEMLTGNFSIFAVVPNTLDGRVDTLLDGSVLLAESDPHTRTQNLQIFGHIAFQVATGLALIGLQECLKSDPVGLRRIDPACGEILIGLVLGLILLDLGGIGE